MLNIGWKQRSGVRSHHINRTRERKKDGLSFCTRRHWLSAANCMNFFHVGLQAVGAISFFNYITVMSCWPRPGPAFWMAGWSAVRNSAKLCSRHLENKHEMTCGFKTQSLAGSRCHRWFHRVMFDTDDFLSDPILSQIQAGIVMWCQWTECWIVFRFNSV